MICLIFHEVLSVQYIKHCHTNYVLMLLQCTCMNHLTTPYSIHDGVRIKQLLFICLVEKVTFLVEKVERERKRHG